MFAARSYGLANPLLWLQAGDRAVERRRIKQRANELVLIKQIERDIGAIRKGSKSIGENGRIVDVAFRYDRDSISVPSIIDHGDDNGEDRAPELNFQNIYAEAKQEQNLGQVENMLIMMRIYIFAETKANLVRPEQVSPTPVSRQWLARWWEAAMDSHTESLQLMWAKILGKEVTKPGSFPLRAIEFMRGVSDSDAEVIRIVSRFSFGEYIFIDANQYFSPEIHEAMFDRLEEWGLIRGKLIGEFFKSIPSNDEKAFSAVMRCQNKALYIHAEDHDVQLTFPIYQVTEMGQAIFSLGTGDADMGYLWAVSTEIKEHGFDVTLGDWLEQRDSKHGLLQAKLQVR